jgi:hypothetical protein
MRRSTVLPEDAPDPGELIRAQARQMPVPVLGLVPQPHIEDWDAIGVSMGTRDGILESCEVSIGYTLWRNPDEPTDPANLAELDENRRRALAAQPPWPRPRWLVEQVDRMRYPMLWECVRTRWCRDRDPSDDARLALLGHVNHVLLNRFPPDVAPSHMDSVVDARGVEPGSPVVVDGVARDGVRLNTDPDVYGLGVDLGAGGVVTAVIPRDALRYLHLAFAARPL